MTHHTLSATIEQFGLDQRAQRIGTDRKQGATPETARGVFPLARAVIVALSLAGLAGASFVAGQLSATPQAGIAAEGRAAQATAMPSVQDRSVTHPASSVPDASAVFAGRETAQEEPAPTF